MGRSRRGCRSRPLSGRKAEIDASAHAAADQSAGALEEFRKRSSNDSRRQACSIRHNAWKSPGAASSINACEVSPIRISALRRCRHLLMPLLVSATTVRLRSCLSMRVLTNPLAWSCLIQLMTNGCDWRSRAEISVTPNGPCSSSASNVDVGGVPPQRTWHLRVRSRGRRQARRHAQSGRLLRDDARLHSARIAGCTPLRQQHDLPSGNGTDRCARVIRRLDRSHHAPAHIAIREPMRGASGPTLTAPGRSASCPPPSPALPR